MCKLNAKFGADSLLYSPSHFECDSHRVHMLTQWHLWSPLTSTVKLLLFTHVHSSPLSFAARVHKCHGNVLVILTMAVLFQDRPRIKQCITELKGETAKNAIRVENLNTSLTAMDRSLKQKIKKK